MLSVLLQQVRNMRWPWSPKIEPCQHAWQPALVLHEPGRDCHKCGTFDQITKNQFQRQFGDKMYKKMLREKRKDQLRIGTRLDRNVSVLDGWLGVS